MKAIHFPTICTKSHIPVKQDITHCLKVLVDEPRDNFGESPRITGLLNLKPKKKKKLHYKDTHIHIQVSHFKSGNMGAKAQLSLV